MTFLGGGGIIRVLVGAPVAAGNTLLLEDGTDILLEDGTSFLLEI